MLMLFSSVIIWYSLLWRPSISSIGWSGSSAHNWQQEGYEETYENVPEFCYSASFDEVKEKGFTLVPSRYIEFVNRDENIDFDTKMKSLQGELKELLVQEEKSKSDLLAVFKELGYEIEL